MPSNLIELRARGLLPFQADFVLDFLQPGSAPVWELSSPPGTGKTLLGTELVRQLLDTHLGARVLILVPAALRLQWVDALTSRGIPASLFDRQRFLERAAGVSEGQPFWAPLDILVVSIDFAKRKDVLSALHSVEWDLLLADESHLLAGKRADAFFGLMAAQRARRGLLLTSLPSERTDAAPIAIVQRNLPLQSILDWEGLPLFERVQAPLEIVTYTRRPEEVTALRDLEIFALDIASQSPELRIRARLLVRAAASSFNAAQRAAWRLRDMATRARTLASSGRAPDPDAPATPQSDLFADSVDTILDATDTPFDPVTFYAHTSPLEDLLAAFDDISDDRKLQALLSLLESSPDPKTRTYVCIWIQFRATAQYLATALDRLAMPVLRLDASMSLTEREMVIDGFRGTGGVLLTTGAAIEGIDLAFVERCIHYDLPADRRALEQRVGRFLRVGRAKPFRSFALRDTEGALRWEEQVFAELEQPPRAP